jgi:tetratricopeptide (TPR) repeat protein
MKSLLMQTYFHLAQVHFSLENFEEAADALKSNLLLDPDSLSPRQSVLNRHSIYLKALISKKLKQFDQAKETFVAYTKLHHPPEIPFYSEALFELGLIEFSQKNYAAATHFFNSLQVEEAKPRLKILSQLYSARLAQLQGNEAEANQMLASLNSNLSKNDPLFFELNYLQGEAAFERKDYAKAIEFFQKSLPVSSPEKEQWYADALYHLGWCYLKMGDVVDDTLEHQKAYLKKAEEIFDRLVSRGTEENAYLALAQCYLIQASRLKEPSYSTKADELLSKNVFTTQEGKARALLFRAEAAPTYLKRDQFYKELTEESNSSNIWYPKGWYMRALNDFEYAKELIQTGNVAAAQNAYQRSADAFEKSWELFRTSDLQQAVSATKYRALAISYSGESKADLEAFHTLDKLIKSPEWKTVQNKDEILYLHGRFAGVINTPDFIKTAETSLKTVAATPDSSFGDLALNYLGALYYKNGDYNRAEETYLQLINDFPVSPSIAEALFWTACCADKQNRDPAIGKARRQSTYEKFPNSPFAAEAFFTYYTYSEYLQGDRTTIKHLQNFVEKFSGTPFLIDSHYLIGLDYKRDRKTTGGRWIRKKSLTDAIDSFQKAELLFDELYEKKIISDSQLNYYIAMRYRATLERAMINLAIAEEAQGAKKQIYLDYAEEVFKNLSEELAQKNHALIKHLNEESSFPLIEEETSFWLAQTFVKANKDEKAEQVLSKMINRYKENNISKGYYLARALDEEGRIAMRKNDYQKALDFFKNAEEASKGNILNTDQRLDLWIQQSLVQRALGHHDDALLILSKVINDDAISALRVKAMYLRAETYELQKRPELARKQFESMVNKGGIWARKAQEKLNKDDLNYGH